MVYVAYSCIISALIFLFHPNMLPLPLPRFSPIIIPHLIPGNPFFSCNISAFASPRPTLLRSSLAHTNMFILMHLLRDIYITPSRPRKQNNTIGDD